MIAQLIGDSCSFNLPNITCMRAAVITHTNTIMCSGKSLQKCKRHIKCKQTEIVKFSTAFRAINIFYIPTYMYIHIILHLHLYIWYIHMFVF